MTNRARASSRSPAACQAKRDQNKSDEERAKVLTAGERDLIVWSSEQGNGKNAAAARYTLEKDSINMGTRIAALAFVGQNATLVYNTFKCDPMTGLTERTQSRREYLGENNSASVRAFALKVLGSGAEHCVANEVAPGLYNIELPSPDDAPAKPSKK